MAKNDLAVTEIYQMIERLTELRAGTRPRLSLDDPFHRAIMALESLMANLRMADAGDAADAVFKQVAGDLPRTPKSTPPDAAPKRSGIVIARRPAKR